MAESAPPADHDGAVRPSPAPIETADGKRIAGTWWEGARASDRALVCLSALAARQRYLAPLAAYLAARGWGVLTFDYRGVAASRAAEDADTTADDWVDLDLPAAVAEVRRRAAPRSLIVLGHSVGGQLLGQSPIRHEIDGALLIAAQRGIPHLFQGVARLRIELAYRIFPAVIALLGHLPPSPLTLPERCPGGPVRQWVGWGRSGVFRDRHGRDVEPRFAEMEAPITALTIADDALYAPPAAVDALVRLYRRSPVERHSITPEAFATKSIGHFGLFRRTAPRALWADLVTHLDRLAERSRARSGEPA